MDKLMLLIKKNRNYYDTDIDIENFVKSINFTECKNYKKLIDSHMNEFFNTDQGEVIGYYVCNCLKLFKFYFIKVNKKLYMALENSPPYFWYCLSSYYDFKNVRKIYNKKKEKYENKNLFIALQLWNGDESQEYIKSNIKNDFEYIYILYNMCKQNMYIHRDIFSKEYHYTTIDRTNMSSLEYSLLDKHIITTEKGFYCRTVFSNSVISVKCANGLLFMTCYYDSCIKNVINSDIIDGIPIDLSIFLSNFKLTTIKNVVKNIDKSIGNDLIRINKYIPVEYYADMRDEIYNVLSDNKSNYDKEYENILKKLFTEHCVNRVIFSLGGKADELKNKTNKDIRKIIKKQFYKEELKYISNTFFKKIKFLPG